MGAKRVCFLLALAIVTLSNPVYAQLDANGRLPASQPKLADQWGKPGFYHGVASGECLKSRGTSGVAKVLYLAKGQHSVTLIETQRGGDGSARSNMCTCRRSASNFRHHLDPLHSCEGHGCHQDRVPHGRNHRRLWYGL